MYPIVGISRSYAYIIFPCLPPKPSTVFEPVNFFLLLKMNESIRPATVNTPPTMAQVLCGTASVDIDSLIRGKD